MIKLMLIFVYYVQCSAEYSKSNWGQFPNREPVYVEGRPIWDQNEWFQNEWGQNEWDQNEWFQNEWGRLPHHYPFGPSHRPFARPPYRPPVRPPTDEPTINQEIIEHNLMQPELEKKQHDQKYKLLTELYVLQWKTENSSLASKIKSTTAEEFLAKIAYLVLKNSNITLQQKINCLKARHIMKSFDKAIRFDEYSKRIVESDKKVMQKLGRLNFKEQEEHAHLKQSANIIVMTPVDIATDLLLQSVPFDFYVDKFLSCNTFSTLESERRQKKRNLGAITIINELLDERYHFKTNPAQAIHLSSRELQRRLQQLVAGNCDVMPGLHKTIPLTYKPQTKPPTTMETVWETTLKTNVPGETTLDTADTSTETTSLATETTLLDTATTPLDTETTLLDKKTTPLDNTSEMLTTSTPSKKRKPTPSKLTNGKKKISERPVKTQTTPIADEDKILETAPLDNTSEMLTTSTPSNKRKPTASKLSNDKKKISKRPVKTQTTPTADLDEILETTPLGNTSEMVTTSTPSNKRKPTASKLSNGKKKISERPVKTQTTPTAALDEILETTPLGNTSEMLTTSRSSKKRKRIASKHTEDKKKTYKRPVQTQTIPTSEISETTDHIQKERVLPALADAPESTTSELPMIFPPEQ